MTQAKADVRKLTEGRRFSKIYCTTCTEQTQWGLWLMVIHFKNDLKIIKALDKKKITLDH